MNLWYVIETKPKKEGEAGTYLSTKGVEIFSPLMETVSLRNGKINKEMRPLFPKYIFGKFDLSRDYALVRWASGVKRVLGFGGYPTSLADEVVETLKGRTDVHGVVRKTHRFSPNDVVRIKTGPLRDLLAIFEDWVSDSERVRILLNLIGYQPTVELHYSFLEKVT